MKRLHENNKLGNLNHKMFLDNLDTKRYRTNYQLDGCRNHELNLILQQTNMPYTQRLMRTPKEEKIEFRQDSTGGENQLRGYYMRKFLGDTDRT